MPTPSDLVTDLPADFAVFGQAVATSMADLLGGTTGQILSKTTATDMDFTWISPNPGDITDIVASTPLTGGGTSGSVTVGIQDASTSQKGSVQLSDSTSTTSSVLAATPTAVKSAYDLANAAPAGNLSGTVLKSTVVTSSLTSFGTAATLNTPLINIGYAAKTATYIPVLADNGYLLSMNNASATTFTIPTNASVAFPIGAQINFTWITGAGQPTIQAVTPGTTTILSTGATSTAPKLRVVNAGATAIKIATDIWMVFGDIS